MKNYLKKNVKRALSIFLSMLMILSCWVWVAPDKASASAAISGYADIYVTVPEIIYLKPASGTTDTFQYFVNNTMNPSTGAISQDAVNNATTGNFYFKCDDAKSVHITFSSGVSSVTGTLNGGSSTTLSGTAGFDLTLNSSHYGYGAISAGKISTPLANKGVSYIDWTFKVTRNDNSTVSFTLKTGVYAPFTQVTGAAGRAYNHNIGAGKKTYVQSIVWWQGISGIGSVPAIDNNGDGHDLENEGSYVPNTNFNPMVTAPTTGGTAAINGYLTSAATGQSNSIKYGNAGDKQSTKWVGPFVTGYTATISCDASRYSNISQIPNLKCGVFVSDYEGASANKDYYLSLYNTGGNDHYRNCYTESDDNKKKYADPRESAYIYSDKDSSKKIAAGSGTCAAGVVYNGSVSYSISAGGTYSFAAKSFVQGHYSGASYCYCFNSLYAPITISTYTKTELRNKLREVTRDYPYDSSYYYTNNSTYNAFKTAYDDAYKVLGNIFATQDQIDTATSTLNTAWENLRYSVKMYPQGNKIVGVDTAKYGTPSGNCNAIIGTASYDENGEIVYETEGKVTGSNQYTEFAYNYIAPEEINARTLPVDELSAGQSKTFISRKGYKLTYFTTDIAGNSTDKIYITHGDENRLSYDDSETYDAENPYVVRSNKTLYGAWQPEEYTVTFINPDGIHLFDNDEQPADHKAYYGGTTPTYKTSASGDNDFHFAGWINMNTGAVITGSTGNLLNEFVYGDTTYMAYYTTSGNTKSYSARFDTDASNTFESGETKTGLKYYDKLYRGTDVPYLQGEVFSYKEWYRWIDNCADVTAGHNGCTVNYADDAITVTSTNDGTDDAYTPWTTEIYPAEPNKAYKFSFNLTNLAGNPGDDMQLFFESVTESGANIGYPSFTFVDDGTCTGTITFTDPNTAGFKLRIDANKKGHSIKISDLKIYCEADAKKITDYPNIALALLDGEEVNTHLYDYGYPVWVDADTGVQLGKNTRMTEDGQSYVIRFNPKKVSYTAKFVRGKTEDDLNTYGSIYVAKSTATTETYNYTLDEEQAFIDGLDYAVGGNNYVFKYWAENPDGSGMRYMPGAAIDEPYADTPIYRSVRTDEGGKTYYAVYEKQTKVYTVKFNYEKLVGDVVTPVESPVYDAHYLEDANVVVPTDQLTEKDDRSFHYTFSGWRNVLDPASGTVSGESIPALYTSISSDAVYEPVYTKTPYYYITFFDANDAPIGEMQYLSGEALTAATADIIAAARASAPEQDEVYTYAVQGWKTKLGAEMIVGSAVIANASYYPNIVKVFREYPVTFTTAAGIYTQSVEYGSSPVLTGIDKTKAPNDDYEYRFDGWDDDSTDIVERYSDDEIADYKVSGDASFTAVYDESTRTYAVVFKDIDAVTFDTATGELAHNGNYTDYQWTDFDVNYGVNGKYPKYFLGERISAPVVIPAHADFVADANHKVRFDGWYPSTEFNANEKLTRTTFAEKALLNTDEEMVFYAHYVADPIDMTVTFFENDETATPLYAAGIAYGASAADAANTAANMLTVYDDVAAGKHKSFKFWAVKGTETEADLTAVNGDMNVYAVYDYFDHEWKSDATDGWEIIKEATYSEAGERTRYCTVCGHRDDEYITILKDEENPTGQIVIKNNVSDTENVALTAGVLYADAFNADANTVYVKGKTVDVMINGRDTGTGVGSVKYFVTEAPLTEAALAAYDWNEAKSTTARNAHFVQKASDLEGDSFIVYAKIDDMAKDWEDGVEIVKGVPATMTDNIHTTYVTSVKVVFDNDIPEIIVSGDDHNEDGTVFCGSATVTVTDDYLDLVTCSKDGGEAQTVTDGTINITEAGTYTVFAQDKGGNEAEFTFTVNEGHDFEFTQTVAPNCTEGGYDLYTCSVCGETEERNAVPALGHTYPMVGDVAVKTVITKATCEADGEKAFICTVCGDISENEIIAACGHKYSETPDANSVPATCSKEGVNYFTCTCEETDEYEACTYVKVVNLEKLPHELAVVEEVHATCTEDGYTLKRCENCGEEERIANGETATGHAYTEWSVSYPETCKAFGLEKRVCETCGHEEYRTIAPHTPTYEESYIKEPTCTASGTYKNVCSKCGLVECNADGKEIIYTEAALGHDYGESITVEPTCTEDGYTYTKCLRCGDTTEHTDIVDALGHDWQPKETVPATYTESGWEVYECSRCHEEKRDPIAPLAENKINFYSDDELLGAMGVQADSIAVTAIDFDEPEKTGYEFTKWVYADGTELGETITFTDDTKEYNLKAVFTPKNYTITWKDGNKTETLAYDSVITEYVPEGDNIPVKERTDTHRYEFIGWSLTENGEKITDFSAVTVTGEMTFYPVFDEIPLEFTIKFVDWNGNVVKEQTNVPYGTEIVAPTLETAEITVGSETVLLKDYEDTTDPNKTLKWSGKWEPTVEPATMDVTYTAIYNVIPKEVNISFYLDEADTAPYRIAVYNAGDTFILPTEGPAKEADDNYTYSFLGWLPKAEQTATAPVDGQALVPGSDGYAYVADYKETPIEYTVTFANEDEEAAPYKEETVNYNSYIDFAPADNSMVKGVDKPEEEGQYVYEFKGWSYKGMTYKAADLANMQVKGNMVLTPVFEKVYTKIAVKFAKLDGGYYAEREFVYNNDISYSGATPLKTRDWQYSYKFLGWNTDENATEAMKLGKATEEVTFYPIFEPVLRKYDITWVVMDKKFTQSVEAGAEVAYPATAEGAPSIDGDTYNTPIYSYEFKGWALTADGAILDAIPEATAKATYYAIFDKTKSEYTAKWFLNEGDEAPLYENTFDYATAMVYGGETPVKTPAAEDASKLEYIFKGWVDQDGNEIAADAANCGKITKNTVFTAVFETSYFEFTATFYGADNTTVYSTKTDYHYGDALVVPADLENYDSEDGLTANTFIGWATTAGATEALDLTDYTVTENVSFYPVYSTEEIKYATVTFVDDNDVTISADTYRVGEAVVVPADPKKEATNELVYTFKGWAKADDLETILEVIPAAAEDVIYKAVFESADRTYRATFYTDEGKVISFSTGTHDGLYLYNETANAPEATKAETAMKKYVFAGWAATKNAAVEDVIYAPTATIYVTADINLYAVFTEEAKTYTVTFVGEDGSEIISYTDQAYNAQIEVPAAPTKANTAEYTYTFDGWYNGKAKLVTVEKDGKEYATVTSDVTYKATFKAEATLYNVYFYNVDKNLEMIEKAYANFTVGYGSTFPTVTEPADYDTDSYNYEFKGWDDLATEAVEQLAAGDLPATVTKNESFKAVFTKTERLYTVKFLNEDGTVVNDGTKDYDFELPFGAAITAPAALTKAEDASCTYSFLGWTTDGKDVVTPDTTVSKSVTYKAKFSSEYKSYTVNFYNGTTLYKSSAYHYNDSVVVPANPTKEEANKTYSFVGWNTEADLSGTTYAGGYIPEVTADTDYYAVFKEEESLYTVRFFVNGALKYTNDYNYGSALDSAAILAINTDRADKNGIAYTFAGWATQEHGTVAYATTQALLNAVTAVTAAANYYAVYTEQERIYNVQWFDEDGTEITGVKNEYKYNDTIVLPADPAKEGVEHNYSYKFNGWAAEQGSKVTVNLLNTTVKADAKYYAVFEKVYVNYSVEFYVDGEKAYNYPSMKYNDSLSFVKKPAKADSFEEIAGVKYVTTYTFTGWFTTPECTGTSYADSAALPAVTANAKYYTVFKETTEKYVPKFTVTFMSGKTVLLKQELEVNSSVAAIAPTGDAVKKAPDAGKHYTFVSWNTSSNPSTGTAYTTANLPAITEDVTYFATYTSASHSFTVDASRSYACSKDNTSKTVSVCSCGYEKTVTGTAKHNWVESGSSTATYRYDGTKSYRCTGCGSTKSEPQAKLGVPVTFTVKNSEGKPISGATVTVFYNGALIDSAVSDGNGNVTVYVAPDGTCSLVVEAPGYETASGTITPSGANIGGLASTTCKCTCHKDTFWAKIYKFLYKILNALFKVRCCSDETYL